MRYDASTPGGRERGMEEALFSRRTRRSENFRVAPQSRKEDALVLLIDSVDQYPVKFNMSVPVVGPLPFKGMVFVAGRQRSFIDKKYQKLVELAKIPTLCDCAGVILFKPLAPGKFQHFLIIHH